MRLSLSLGLLMLAACQKPVPPAPPPQDRATLRARRAVDQLRSSLQKALGQALQRDRSSAIEVCRVKAPALARQASQAHPGVTVGRTSHRLRNPDNAPPPWVKPLLDEYRRQGPGAAPRTVSLEGGRVGYVEPIYLKSICLSCHGPELDPVMAGPIRQSYPGDQATGFREGELRGLHWAEVTP